MIDDLITKARVEGKWIFWRRSIRPEDNLYTVDGFVAYTETKEFREYFSCPKGWELIDPMDILKIYDKRVKKATAARDAFRARLINDGKLIL